MVLQLHALVGDVGKADSPSKWDSLQETSALFNKERLAKQVSKSNNDTITQGRDNIPPKG